jgi:hypothetical protein
MGKVYWFTAAAILAVAGIVGWAAPTTHARVVAPDGDRPRGTISVVGERKESPRRGVRRL